ncbi:DinB family protein [Flavobacterium aquidurense]|uniref:DinB 2 domain containing protein n=1 Tax=Flavobacterium aquidurense TaxID=362413 RepID=A0A0Q0WXM0_9FLAO|nr:DinB family protein [Flavobacterium aquidurense]KQB41035.1 DinB 2 domain containing protein [Flavobacterium aquidurense]
MNSVFEVQKTIREVLVKILDNHSLEQLNKIPQGFNNNIIWNAAHCVAVQQALVYKLSGLPTMVSKEFIVKYSKGAKPEGDVSQEEVDEVKALLSTTLQQTKQDYSDAIFVNFQEYTTSLGNTISDINGALEFNNYHEGLHTGVIMSIRKFV